MTYPLDTAARRRQHRHAPHPKREGAALLIVLFILMMSTATAVFAMQSTQFEQRAAGSLQQAMRTKYISEAATMSVLGLCYELGPKDCVTNFASLNNWDGNRAKFAAPSWGGVERVIEILPNSYSTATWPVPMLPSDSVLVDLTTNTSGAASPYTPSFTNTMEQWQITDLNPTSQPRFRLIVSTYGMLNVTGAVDASTTARGNHESISVTRAFIDQK